MTAPLEEMMKHVNSRYRLTLLAAQRANALASGVPSLVEVESKKPSVIALEEIASGKVYYEAKPEAKAKKS